MYNNLTPADDHSVRVHQRKNNPFSLPFLPNFFLKESWKKERKSMNWPFSLSFSSAFLQKRRELERGNAKENKQSPFPPYFHSSFRFLLTWKWKQRRKGNQNSFSFQISALSMIEIFSKKCFWMRIFETYRVMVSVVSITNFNCVCQEKTCQLTMNFRKNQKIFKHFRNKNNIFWERISLCRYMEILRKISSFVNNILQATVDIPYHHCGYLYVQTAFEKRRNITLADLSDNHPIRYR